MRNHVHRSPSGQPPPARAERAHMTPARSGAWQVAIWAPVAVLAWAIVDGDGSSVGQLLPPVLVIIVAQVVPGLAIWRSIRGDAGTWLEDLGVGFAVGAALAVAAHAMAATLGAPMVATAAPALVALAVLVRSRRGLRQALLPVTQALPIGVHAAVALSVAAALVLVRPFVERHPVQWTGLSVPYVDLPFHLALSAQLAHRGPTEFAHVAGEPLAYHWATYAWVGHTSIAGTLALDVTLMRVLPVVAVVAGAAAVGGAAIRVSGGFPWAAAAAIPFGLLTALPLGALMGGIGAFPLTPASPTQMLAIPVAGGLVSALAFRWRSPGRRNGSTTLLLLLLLGFAALVKGSLLPPVVAGLLLAAVSSRGEERRHVAAEAALATVVLAVVTVVVFRGSSGGLVLDPGAVVRRTSASWAGQSDGRTG